MRRALGVLLVLGACACRSPLADLETPGRPFRFAAAPPAVEDHSRQLKRLRSVSAEEANSPEARKAALSAHAGWLKEAVRQEASARGLLADAAPWTLELKITSLGEVRARYIFYGIAGGVAWGVGTGLATGNGTLALGLGAYELVEESAFWIGGSSLFAGRFAPAVVEASLRPTLGGKAVWSETYYVLSGRRWTKGLPEAARKRREVQVRASLEEVVARLFKDLERVPGVAPHAVDPEAVRAALLR